MVDRKVRLVRCGSLLCMHSVGVGVRRREKRTVEEVRGPLDGRVGDNDAVDAFDGVDCIRDVV